MVLKMTSIGGRPNHESLDEQKGRKSLTIHPKSHLWSFLTPVVPKIYIPDIIKRSQKDQSE